MFLKRFGATLCFLSLFVSSALAQSTGDSQFRNNQATFETLESKLVTVDFFETRFEDVLGALTQSTDLVFVLDESAADNNLDEETLISRGLTETRLATVLEFILGEFQCTWKILDGVVVIISRDAALDSESFGLMVFDCADLIGKIKSITVKHYPGASRPVVGSFGTRRRRSLGGGVFSVTGSQEEKQEPAENAGEKKEAETDQPPAPQPMMQEVTSDGREQLMAVIVESIDPDSWVETGGNGSITPLNDVFVVRQTQANLREIREFLNQLRASGLE